MMRSRVRLAGLLAVVAVLALGCGAEQAPVTSSAGSPSGDTRSAVDPEPETEAKHDVRIAGCSQGSFTPEVDVEVTNSTRKPYRYAVTVRVENSAGKHTDAYFVRGRMGPGKTVAEKVPGANPVPGRLTCRVTEAKRLPPQ